MHWPTGHADTRSTSDRNEQFLKELERLVGGVGVIPFVGAGMSMPSRFPSWTGFLRDVAREFFGETRLVDPLIEAGDYERAASALEAQSPEVFEHAIRQHFGDEEPNVLGPVADLPGLCDGPVLTTNFDCVLETVFARSNRLFVQTIYGGRAEPMVRALSGGRRYLFKVHGDARDEDGRVLTAAQYEKHYGRQQPGPEDFESLPLLRALTTAFTSRTILFLGCSLNNDRTVRILRSLKKRRPVADHYAVVEAPTGDDAAKAERLRDLLECGIKPIFIHKDEFETAMPPLILRLVHARHANWKAQRLVRPVPQVASADVSGGKVLSEALKLLESGNRVRVLTAPENDWPGTPDELKLHLDRFLGVARRGGTYERIIQVPRGARLDVYHPCYQEHFREMVRLSEAGKNVRLAWVSYSYPSTFVVIDDDHVVTQVNHVSFGNEGQVLNRVAWVDVTQGQPQFAARYVRQFEAIRGHPDTREIVSLKSLDGSATPEAEAATELERRRVRFESHFMENRAKWMAEDRSGGALLDALRCAKGSISICGINALQPIHGGFEQIKRVLKAEGTVRVLLLDCNSEYFRTREGQENAGHSGRLRAEWIAAVAALADLNKQRDGRGSLALRIYRERPSASIVLIDDWLAMYNPYVDLDPDTPRGYASELSFWMNRPSEGGAEKFQASSRHFASLWQRCEDLEISLKHVTFHALFQRKLGLTYSGPRRQRGEDELAGGRRPRSN